MTHKAQAATYTVLNTNDSGVGSLRQAISDTNASVGVADTINFAIPGTGPHVITPASSLPGIHDTVTIDGSTQPSASCGVLVPTIATVSNTPHTLEITIDGTNSDGIFVFDGGSASDNANNSVIKGFNLINTTSYKGAIGVLPGFGGQANNLQFNCNYIGTDISGTTAQANTTGIYLYNTTGTVVSNNLISGNQNGISAYTNTTTIQNNLIGTTSTGMSLLGNSVGMNLGLGVSAHDNIVSGNTTGVQMTDSTVLQHNLIGLNLAGTAVIANSGDGVLNKGSSSVIIGGSTAGERNVISGNGGNGINVLAEDGGGDGCSSGAVSGTNITGNYIGTNISGSTAAGFGNGQNGIVAHAQTSFGCSATINNITIGGDAAGEPNTIAGNTLDGIRIYQAGPSSQTSVFGVVILPNSIFSNGQLGINLALDTANNGVADADLGPNVINSFLMSYLATNANYYINRPTINSTSVSGNQLTVNYNYQANEVEDNLPAISAVDIVGYRLDFYLNNDTQDGAYTGYAQGKTHLGSFVVDGSETNATHTFTSPIPLIGSQNITVTSTVLWKTIPDPGTNCQDDQWGNGPPYTTTCIFEN